MKDFRELLPHSKKENKFNHKVRLTEVNEMAEAKNCQKVMLFEGRAHQDLFFWLANVHVGPSVWFEVSLVFNHCIFFKEIFYLYYLK